MLKTGLKGWFETTVSNENTAKTMRSGDLPVFATPALAAAIEAASVACVQGMLEEGSTTVGTELRLKHTSATPVGMQVKAEAELVGIDGRKLIFHAVAYDSTGVIGEAEHTRMIVQAQRFMNKIQEKGRSEC